ncbi:unnamed protein product [Effrenium voratum]|nr:unnamed protein product [Effrenium voratum]
MAGPLSSEEISLVVNLVGRAVRHGQAVQLAETINESQESVFTLISNVPENMSDASKRRRDGTTQPIPDSPDTVSEWELAENANASQSGLNGPSYVTKVLPTPMPSTATSVADTVAKNVTVTLPKGVSSVQEWGRTIVKLPRWASKNWTYMEIVSENYKNKEVCKYLSWNQNRYRDAPAESFHSGSRLGAAFRCHWLDRAYQCWIPTRREGLGIWTSTDLGRTPHTEGV